jgi:hypothetical protein
MPAVATTVANTMTESSHSPVSAAAIAEDARHAAAPNGRNGNPPSS